MVDVPTIYIKGEGYAQAIRDAIAEWMQKDPKDYQNFVLHMNDVRAAHGEEIYFSKQTKLALAMEVPLKLYWIVRRHLGKDRNWLADPGVRKQFEKEFLLGMVHPGKHM